MSNERLYPYYEIVEQAISQLGVNAEDTRLDDEGRWQLDKGGVSVIIEVWEMEREEKKEGYVMVFAPLMQLNENATAAFYRRALEMSHNSLGVSYTIFNDHLLVSVSRELADMSVDEMLLSILRVGNTAEENLEELQNLHAQA
jgi:hypothetical protein